MGYPWALPPPRGTAPLLTRVCPTAGVTDRYGCARVRRRYGCRAPPVAEAAATPEPAARGIKRDHRRTSRTTPGANQPRSSLAEAVTASDPLYCDRTGVVANSEPHRAQLRELRGTKLRTNLRQTDPHQLIDEHLALALESELPDTADRHDGGALHDSCVRAVQFDENSEPLRG